MNILPCPFCGEVEWKPEVYAKTNQRGKETGFYSVRCNECGCDPGGHVYTEAEAIKFWNTRATFSGTQEAHTGFEIARKTMIKILETLEAPMKGNV